MGTPQRLNRCKFYDRSQLVSPTWGLLTKGISGEAKETYCNEDYVTQEQDGGTSTSELPFEAKTDPQQESIVDKFSLNHATRGGIVRLRNG